MHTGNPMESLTDIHHIIATSIKLFKDTTDEEISFHKKLTPVPAIKSDPALLIKLMSLLFENASRAGSNHITIRTFANRDHVTIAVIDDGAGIAEEDLDRIFEAGNSDESAIGSAFSACYQIVQELGGTIRIGSKAGEGTVVTISL